MKGKKVESDIAFYVWVGILGIAIISVFFAMWIDDGAKGGVVASSSPQVTTVLPSPSASVEPVYVFKHQIPRTANISLNQNILWETSIGGSGTDIPIGAISLDSTYIYGNTTSADYDFNASGQDVFIAKLESGGNLCATVSFGSQNTDRVFCVTAFSDVSNGLISVVQADEIKNEITVYKMPLDLSIVASTNIKFEHSVELIGYLSCEKNLYLLGNEKRDNGSVNPIVVSVSFDFLSVKCVKFQNYGGLDVVSAYMLGNKCIFVCNGADNRISVLTAYIDDETAKNVEQTKLSFLNELSADSCEPCSFGGYILRAHSVVSGSVKSYFIKLDNSFNIEFCHEISGADYSDVKIIPDVRMNVLGGYHIYAEKESAQKVLNNYEYVCLHGDLTVYEEGVLQNHKIELVRTLESGYILVTRYLNGAQWDVGIVCVNVHNATNEYLFGGSGKDVPTAAIQNVSGELIVVCSSTSVDGDVLNNFGKSDVWCFAPDDIF